MVKHAAKKAFCAIRPKLATWPRVGNSKLEVNKNFNIVVVVFEIRENSMFMNSGFTQTTGKYEF